MAGTDHILERRAFGVGDKIFSEGQQGDRAYIIQEGKVEVFRSVGGEDVVLGSLGKGAIFGEMALLDDSPRMASARATESTTVIIISRPMFDEKMRKTDPFIRGLLNILADGVRAGQR